MKLLCPMLAATCCVGIAQAQPGDAREFDCLIEPHRVANVGSPVFGILETVEVERGDFVRRGQIVARLQSAVEQATVDLARVQADFDRREVVRNEDLYRDELISIHDKDEMETRSLISQLELAEAEEILRQRQVESPLDGIVVERFLSPGEFVQEAPILTIAQLDPLNVEVVLPVIELGSVEVGLDAEVLPAAPRNGSHRARVVIVDRVVDAASGTFGVRLELPNPDLSLPAGLRCRVRFEAQASP